MIIIYVMSVQGVQVPRGRGEREGHVRRALRGARVGQVPIRKVAGHRDRQEDAEEDTCSGRSLTASHLITGGNLFL